MANSNDKIFLGENMPYSEEEIDRIIKDFIQRGWIEEAGIDKETGEPSYKITEMGKGAIPELYEESLSVYNMICFKLWEKNMINLTFDDKGMPLVALNKNSFDEEKIKLLADNERFILRQMLGFMQHNNDII
jgi:hypothetical protein